MRMGWPALIQKLWRVLLKVADIVVGILPVCEDSIKDQIIERAFKLTHTRSGLELKALHERFADARGQLHAQLTLRFERLRALRHGL